ncbi:MULTISPECIES: YnjH family protein [Pseudoalteromonas]|uniref:Orphan protein n=2 Tax=Pseudoalteromonas TaxID=53246 RepID=Q3IC05_PSET1|nr:MULTISPECIES: YnjH family protein [Pseudoalteromonas]ASM56047.1 hypothetical protein PNIG_b0463 [Pseudoalteromonas nigrifaciens]MBE0421683.1 DUF1496 domain-containing protein [Pseudoalteromonas nigrifaciens]MBH0072023.1 DUF1496 domain-containing protein [Pseudoalteromonas sp. NZS127]MBH0091580.1 DUF1496 domain-containing protein [Pseudoalteromonas sp. SCQQ13]MBO7924954.1 DUF1496 domain-containing protein [Pseudoalteromonas sp. K222D]
MRHLLILCFYISCLSYSLLSHANTIKTHSVIDANQFVNTDTSCWYDNKRYSEGALIQIHSFTLICGAKFVQHNNSQLIWLKLDKQGNAIYPTKPATITVN